MRNHAILRFLGHRLLKTELWNLHRRSVGGAFFIGLSCAFLPIPTQMLVAASMAIIGRCNIPLFRWRHLGYQPVNHGSYVFLRLQAGRLVTRHSSDHHGR
mgnify:CR=1 FL=1